MQQNGVVWINREILSQMLTEAERVFPKETGGVFIGYWIKLYEEAVITQATGPGPGAIHKPYNFLPDSEYQETEIKKYYEVSGRLHTYLGDWHTHPQAAAYLSPTDKRTLRRIALHSEARAPVPLMAILGEGPDWILKFWRYVPPRYSRFNFTIKTASLKVLVF